MNLKKMKKEDLEMLSNADITKLIIEENGCQSTPELFKKIIELLELPSSTFDNKIGDYYTKLTTDKRFILLENGKWDLRKNHKSDKLKILEEDDEEEIDEEEENEELEDDSLDELNSDDNEDELDDSNDDLKDLVIIDEDEMESE